MNFKAIIAMDCINVFSLFRLTDLVLISQISSEASSSQQQVPPAFKNFSMTQKEKTLDELVRDKWLCRTRERNIGLGIRSLLDLRSWFRNNDVPSCEVCNEAGVKVCILKKPDWIRTHIVMINLFATDSISDALFSDTRIQLFRRICVQPKVALSGYTSTASKNCYLKGYTLHTYSLDFPQ